MEKCVVKLLIPLIWSSTVECRLIETDSEITEKKIFGWNGTDFLISYRENKLEIETGDL